MTKIKKEFKWEEVKPGDELIVIDGDCIEYYMAIIDESGNWYDLMFLSREECEYMPAKLSYSSYEDCILHLYPDTDELEIRLDRKEDRDDAIEFAYNKGFKPRKTVTIEEIESLLGHKVRIVS